MWRRFAAKPKENKRIPLFQNFTAIAMPLEFMIYTIKNKYNRLDIHTREVFKRSFSSTIVNALGLLLALVVSVFLGRTIGADGLGIINLSNRIVTIALLFSLFGVRTVLLKNISIGYYLKDWQRIKSYIYTSYIFNGLLSITIVVVLLILTPWFSESVFKEPRLKIPLAIAILTILPQTFSRIFSAGINGFGKIWQSNLANLTLSMSIILFILYLYHMLDIELTVAKVAISYAIGYLVVAFLMGLYWQRLFSSKEQYNFILKKILKVAIPLSFISICSAIMANADGIILGWFVGSKEVGLYTVAAKLSLLTSFFLQITNSAISPKLAGLYAGSRKAEMQKMIQQTTKLLFSIAVIFLILLIFFGKYLLRLWGNEFVSAYPILIILSIGQFFNMSTGCSGLLLVMCGYEKLHGYISLGFLVFNLIVNYILIINFGAIGAAIASMTTVVGENATKVIMSRIKIGFITLPTNINFIQPK